MEDIYTDFHMVDKRWDRELLSGMFCMERERSVGLLSDGYGNGGR